MRSVGVQLCVGQRRGNVGVRIDRERQGWARVEAVSPYGGRGARSDRLEWSRRGNAFDVRYGVSDGEREGICDQLVAEWRRLEAEWVAGDMSGSARWVPGCPVRLSIGGVGGGSMLCLTPEPVLWPPWLGVVDSRRNVRGLLFDSVGAHGTAADRLGQRSKPPSAGGKMAGGFSPTGRMLSLPTLITWSEAKMLFGSDTLSEESSAQNVHSDKAAWRFGARRVS